MMRSWCIFLNFGFLLAIGVVLLASGTEGKNFYFDVGGSDPLSTTETPDTTETTEIPEKIDSPNDKMDPFKALHFTNSNSNKSVEMSEGRERLLTAIFENYDKKNYPSNLVLGFAMALLKLHLFDSKFLGLDTWHAQTWVDPRFEWDPAHFGGEKSLLLNEDEIWTPDLTLFNSRDPARDFECQKSNVRIWHTGQILWPRACFIAPRCKLNFDPSYYEEQTCELKFGSWSMDGFELDLLLLDDSMSLKMYQENDEWELVGEQPMKKHTIHSPPTGTPYVYLSANLTLQRRKEEEPVVCDL